MTRSYEHHCSVCGGGTSSFVPGVAVGSDQELMPMCRWCAQKRGLIARRNPSAIYQFPSRTQPLKLEPKAIPLSDAMREWGATRPESVRALLAEFPLGTVVSDNEGREFYVIGASESDCVIISPIWVGDDYHAALEQRRYAHAAHLRDGSVKVKFYREPESVA